MQSGLKLIKNLILELQIKDCVPEKLSNLLKITPQDLSPKDSCHSPRSNHYTALPPAMKPSPQNEWR